MKKNSQSGNALAIFIVGILVVAVASIALWHWWYTAHQPAQNASTPASGLLTPGTDNADLDTDLSTISKSADQESANITAANAALNDQQSQITIPKVAVAKLADGVLQTNAKLSALATKMQTRITDGKNAASLQTELDVMNESMTEAGITASSIKTKVTTLQPADYTSDHSLLSSYRNQLRGAHQENISALGQARIIVSGIKAQR